MLKSSGFGCRFCICDFDQFKRLNNNEDALFAFSLNSGIRSLNSSLVIPSSFSKSKNALMEDIESFKSCETIENSLSFTSLTSSNRIFFWARLLFFFLSSFVVVMFFELLK